ncbi:MAG: hypothetical protein ACRCX5_05325 [Bacteroidales bacterium]
MIYIKKAKEGDIFLFSVGKGYSTAQAIDILQGMEVCDKHGVLKCENGCVTLDPAAKFDCVIDESELIFVCKCSGCFEDHKKKR